MSAGTKQAGQQEPDAAGVPNEVAASANGQQASAFSVPLTKRGAIYTMTAREGLDAAELVKAAFARKTIGVATPFAVEVLAPDGPSTAGGKRARQAVRLVPVGGDGAPVMCGSVDVARKVVELRSYRSVAEQYQQRFGKLFGIAEAEYAGLCRDLEATLSAFRYSFVHEAEGTPKGKGARTKSLELAQARPSGPLLNIVLLGLVALVVAGVALVMFLK